MAPLLLLTPAWLAGIFIAQSLHVDSLWLTLGGCVGLLAALVSWLYARLPAPPARLKVIVWSGLLLTAFCVGGLRFLLSAPSTGPNGLLYYLDQPDLQIVGVVSAEPTYSARTANFRLDAQTVLPDGATDPVNVSGEIYVQVAASVQVQPGEQLQLTGKLVAPHEISGEDFPYRDWLARQGIFVTMSYPTLHTLAHSQESFLTAWPKQLRQNIGQTLTRYVPDEEGGLLDSILFGDKSLLSPTLTTDFTTAGLTHILVVSGSNISITIGLLILVLNHFLARPKVLGIALAVMVFYVLLVGFSPSVVRAGLMSALALVGMLIGREYSGLLGLSFSAFLMTLWWPYVLLDIGFQLSFMATLGLVWLSQPWLVMARKQGWPTIFGEALVLTSAAQVLTLPLLGFYFHQVSLVSLLSNVLVVPVLEVITGLGGLILGVAWVPFLGPLLAQTVGGVAWLGLAYIITVVKFCDLLPGASQEIGPFHAVWLLIYYVLLILVVWWWRTGRHNQTVRQFLVRTEAQPVWLAGLGVLAGVVWLMVWLI